MSGSSKLSDNNRSAALGPALVVALAMALLVAWKISAGGGDPLALARLGTQFSDLDPAGTEGYDGQFVYYIAKDLNPDRVEPLLDVPAYRYQRILLPLLAHLVALGDERWIAWVLPGIGILAHVGGVWLIARMLISWDRTPWVALIYGLWVGFSLAIALDLPEPLAYGLVAGALYASLRGRTRWSWLLYALAIFAKEVAVVFVLAQLVTDAYQRRWREVLGLAVVALVPYALFQLWLWSVFGSLGIGSGGAYATPFEWIPFWGFLQVGKANLALLGIYLIVFGPTVLLPTIWGLWEGRRQFVPKNGSLVTSALLLNCLVIPFLPFSTFREPGGLLRFACGLVLAVLLYAGRYDVPRVLRYGWFLLFLNVFLIE